MIDNIKFIEEILSLRDTKNILQLDIESVDLQIQDMVMQKFKCTESEVPAVVNNLVNEYSLKKKEIYVKPIRDVLENISKCNNPKTLAALSDTMYLRMNELSTWISDILKQLENTLKVKDETKKILDEQMIADKSPLEAAIEREEKQVKEQIKNEEIPSLPKEHNHFIYPKKKPEPKKTEIVRGSNKDLSPQTKRGATPNPETCEKRKTSRDKIGKYGSPIKSEKLEREVKTEIDNELKAQLEAKANSKGIDVDERTKVAWESSQDLSKEQKEIWDKIVNLSQHIYVSLYKKLKNIVNIKCHPLFFKVFIITTQMTSNERKWVEMQIKNHFGKNWQLHVKELQK